MVGEFDSAWLKWGRAVTHAEALEAELVRFGDELRKQPVARFKTAYDSKRHGFPYVIVEVTHFPPILRLLLGDAVQEFRAALDHLAWALVQSGRSVGALKDRQLRSIYFPITSTNEEFNEAVRTRLPGVGRREIAIIRRFQPYRRGKTAGPWHAFALLQRMSNDDKHREIQDLWLVASPPQWHVETRDCMVTRIRDSPDRSLQVGAELAFVQVRKTGIDPGIEVRGEFSAYPSFGNDVRVDQWVNATATGVQKLLSAFGPAPDHELGRIGIDAAWVRRAYERYERTDRVLSQRRGGRSMIGNPWSPHPG